MFHVYKDPYEVCEALAKWIAELIKSSSQGEHNFTWALSGGETPKLLYQKLASDFREKINWQRIEIFWGDERCVPFDDEMNNAKMAYDNLLSKVNIPSSHIHKMRTDISAEDSAKEYDELLHKYFNKRQNSFDLTLLGMGDDGHTLSIFPGTEIRDTKWVSAVHSKEKGERISLMPSIVNRSSLIAFLITGEKKANVLKQILQEPEKHNYPVQLIKPENGELHWFLDEAAVRLLEEPTLSARRKRSARFL